MYFLERKFLAVLQFHIATDSSTKIFIFVTFRKTKYLTPTFTSATSLCHVPSFLANLTKTYGLKRTLMSASDIDS